MTGQDRTGQDRTGQAFKLDIPVYLCLAAFAILGMFTVELSFNIGKDFWT